MWFAFRAKFRRERKKETQIAVGWLFVVTFIVVAVTLVIVVVRCCFTMTARSRGVACWASCRRLSCPRLKTRNEKKREMFSVEKITAIAAFLVILFLLLRCCCVLNFGWVDCCSVFLSFQLCGRAQQQDLKFCCYWR